MLELSKLELKDEVDIVAVAHIHTSSLATSRPGRKNRARTTVPSAQSSSAMPATSITTESMDAALRGSRSRRSSSDASGNRRIENRQEKISGESTSFAMIVKYPSTSRLTDTHISLK